MKLQIRRLAFSLLIVLGIGGTGLGYYLFRPLAHKPEPATFECLNLKDGRFEALDARAAASGHIYGVGLAYANHIAETAADFQPGGAPPLFLKAGHTLVKSGQAVKIPDSAGLIQAAENFEPGLGGRLKADHPELPALLDYETELAFVLLADISPGDLARDDFAPHIGFFVANDLSARSLAILGEGRPNRHEYWGVSKSFPGFLPISDRVWIPATPRAAGIPCVKIETLVNGQTRQSESTSNLIYTPREMLRHIQNKYPNFPLRKGDIVLTGTPGGVAFHTPRWLARLSGLVGMDRFKKLNAVLGRDHSGFLKSGDTVIVRGEGLGEVRTTLE